MWSARLFGLAIHASKKVIESCFDASFEPEARLSGKIRAILPAIEVKGLGQLISCPRSVLGGKPFVVLLSDVLVEQSNLVVSW